MYEITVSDNQFINECKGLHCAVTIATADEIVKGVAYVSEDFVQDYIDETIIDNHGADPEQKVSKEVKRQILMNPESYLHTIKTEGLIIFISNYGKLAELDALKQRLKEKGIITARH